jgi:hypothetical protein
MTEQKQIKENLSQELVEQEPTEKEYLLATKLDQIAAAERVARLLLSDDDPDGVCPV